MDWNNFITQANQQLMIAIGSYNPAMDILKIATKRFF
jgi:hypothetical protein